MVEENQNTNNTNQNKAEEDEISLISIIKTIWNHRKSIYISLLFFLVLGLFFAVLMRKEYTADVTLMPEAGKAGGGGASDIVQQFGGMAGLDVGGGNRATGINPNLYPDITESTPFYLHLMQQKVLPEDQQDSISIKTYFNETLQPAPLEYIEEYTLGLPNKILALPGKIYNLLAGSREKETNASTLPEKNANLRLTPEERKAIGELRNRIETTNEANGMVKVNVNMPVPDLAATITQLSVDYLTNYVKNYRVEKARENLKFIRERHAEAKAEFKKAQQKLANFRDRNTNITTARAQTQEEQLQNEYNLTYNLYNDLSQRLEQAKIRVQEETPVFKVLEPVKVPSGYSSPNKKLIIFASIFAGIIFGIGFIFLRVFYLKIKGNWHQYDEI